MKKNVKIVLIVLLATLAVVCLAACNAYNRTYTFTPYTAYEITKVNITQTSRTACNYTVTCDIAPSNSAKVYVTHYDKIASDDVAIDYVATNGNYVFDCDVSFASYYIHVVDGEKTAVLPMTRPQMTPTLTANGTSNVLSYNFVNGTSWSSFCDPTGKSVYKSAQSTFDESTATLVAKNVAIAYADSTTDIAASDDMPYYYVVLSAKNGIVTYVTTPIICVEKAFSGMQASLETINGVASLKISGTSLLGGTLAVELYSADTTLGRVVEVLGDEVNIVSGQPFTATIDVSKILSGEVGAGIWYDVKISSSFGMFDVYTESADMMQEILSQGAKFEFKEWGGLLKVNYGYGADFVVSSVNIQNVDGVPTLIVKGNSIDSVKCVKLHADAEYGPKDANGSNKHHQYWNNVSTAKNEFEFRVKLTDLPVNGETWSWFHVYAYDVANVSNSATPTGKSDLKRGGVLKVDQKFVYNGVVYTVKAWTDGSDVGTGLAISTKVVQG